MVGWAGLAISLPPGLQPRADGVAQGVVGVQVAPQVDDVQRGMAGPGQRPAIDDAAVLGKPCAVADVFAFNVEFVGQAGDGGFRVVQAGHSGVIDGQGWATARERENGGGGLGGHDATLTFARLTNSPNFKLG